ncbi:conserved hypothetical protein [Histoplasma capsulatum var. duboisii H88]|uniref:Uncharacterized protein n=1 Tax=Ajellomyces capsulatus (strain H88) TaxID=544711 RepID=F0UDR8_AJEC8|nr:conserved hypothetical protein [Histoplasma capsulatum var. duboisii H88]
MDFGTFLIFCSSPTSMTMSFSRDWTSRCSPSHPQLALALAIVKSKPSNTTIKDHILEIRRHIHDGKAYRCPEFPEKHLDSITFWREAYEKSESAQSTLLDKIYELEQRNATLILKNGECNASEPKSSLTKRKMNGDGDSAKLSHSQKRSKTMKNGRLNTSRPQATTPFLRHFHALQKQLLRKFDSDALVSFAVGLCESIDTAVRLELGDRGIKTRISTQEKTLQILDPDLQHALQGIRSSYPCLLQALKKLSVNDDTGSASGVITYHIIQLFQRTLGHMHRYIVLKGKERIAQGSFSGKKIKRSKTKMPKTCTGQAYQLLFEEEKTLNLFSHFLASMILSLNPVRPQENNLLEGFLCSILEHVGRALSLFVFKELYSNPDLRLNPAKLPMPGNFDKEHPTREEIAVAQRAAECEAKHLIWILERAMAFADQFERASDETKNDMISTETTPSGGPFQGILHRARTKLQNTLLKGIFGENEPEFRNSLRMPEKPPYSLPEEFPGRAFISAEIDPAEWFTQEVWRIVGWDVLLNEKHG